MDESILPSTTAIDLEGQLVLPGLIDAHAHLHSLGAELTSLNITGTISYQKIIDSIAVRVQSTEPGEWIFGGRWDQNDWEEKSFPLHDSLSEVSPDNPVFLSRIDGNAAFANQKALELAGITCFRSGASNCFSMERSDREGLHFLCLMKTIQTTMACSGSHPNTSPPFPKLPWKPTWA